jgi:ribosomal-protein-alanine N-acetyltransferase
MMPSLEADQITIRSADASNIGDLIAIGDEAGLCHWTAQNYLDEFKREDAVIMTILNTQNEIIGFICGRIPDSWPHEAEIFNIAVKPDHRGKGRSLLDRFLQICVERDVAKVWLDVRASNLTAQTFYEKNGFVRIGMRKNFYSNPVEDGLLMCLSVETTSA